MTEQGDGENQRLIKTSELHQRLRHVDKGELAKINGIKAAIRAQVPALDTARALPQLKTPNGRTRVLHMNYMRSQTDMSGQIELGHLQFFAKTSQNLGLRLEIFTDKSCCEDIDQEFSKGEYGHLDYGITISQGPVSKWAEDSVEYLQNGQIAVPSLFDDDLLEWAMKAGRRERWREKASPEILEKILRDDHLWILLGIRVNASRTGLERLRAAQDQGYSVGRLRAYIEGGNMIAGEDGNGNPVILIGRDAIAATAHLYQLNNDEVRQLIREDFGLGTIHQVVAVEQPGKFHLDMGMLFIGQGTVILNDSSEALQDATEMAELVPCETTLQKAVKLKLQCSLEDDAARDLQVGGLQVQRKSLEKDFFYNFFNGEFVEGADGRPYFITNGGPEEQEKMFETLMVREWNVVRKVFFSPQEMAQKSLQQRGGVGCRLKGSRPLRRAQGHPTIHLQPPMSP